VHGPPLDAQGAGPELLWPLWNYHLDGREHGRTPLTLRLPPGPHHLRFRREGYLEELTLQTRPGLSATLEVRLRPDPARQRPA
jgi:hypothetical protein